MITRRLLLWLAAWAVLAPVPMIVLLALARLLAAMGDGRGARFIDAAALVLGAAWTVGLIVLLLGLAVYTLFPPDDDHEA